MFWLPSPARLQKSCEIYITFCSTRVSTQSLTFRANTLAFWCFISEYLSFCTNYKWERGIILSNDGSQQKNKKCKIWIGCSVGKVSSYPITLAEKQDQDISFVEITEFCAADEVLCHSGVNLMAFWLWRHLTSPSKSCALPFDICWPELVHSCSLYFNARH